MMTCRISIPEAREIAEQFGCNVLEQRGFYSHFLRIRREYETLATIDIIRKSVSRRSLTRHIFKMAK